VRNFIGKKFERRAAAKQNIFCFIDDSHAPATNLTENPVMRYGLPDQTPLSPLQKTRD
jgi:hypothetical protein